MVLQENRKFGIGARHSSLRTSAQSFFFTSNSFSRCVNSQAVAGTDCSFSYWRMKICTPVARRSILWQCNVCHAWCLYSESVWTFGPKGPAEMLRNSLWHSPGGRWHSLQKMQKLPQVSLLSSGDTESTSGKTRLALLESHPGNDQFKYLWSTPGLTFQRCKAQLLQQPSKLCNRWHGQPHIHLWKT